MSSTNKSNNPGRVRRLSPAVCALAALLIAGLFWACNVNSDKGHVYFDLKADTAWAKYDTLHITWSDPASSSKGDLYYGTPSDFGSVHRLQADDYHGQKIEITVTGIQAKKIAHVEKIEYDGGTGKVEKTLQILSSATTLSYDPTPLTLGEHDSLDLPKVTVGPEELFDKTLQWSSSNTGIFIVSGTRLIAKGKGSASLTAQLVSDPSKVLAIAVTVQAYSVPVQSVKFMTDSLAVRAGGPAESLLVTVSPTGANPGVDFKISDESKASLSGRALSGLAAGTVSIVAQSKESPDRKDTLIVIIQAPPDTSKHIPLPAVPAITTLTPDDGRITVAWGADSGADTYNLYYGEGGSVDKASTRVKSVVSPYAISGLKNGTVYGFALTAVNVTGETGLSPAKTAMPAIPIAPAPALSGADAADAKATVTWAPVAGALSYNLYYKAGASVDKSGSKIPGAVSPAVVTGLTNDGQYAFAVSTVSAGGESSLSNILTATPKALPPGAPALSAATAGDAKVTVTWGAVAGAISYNLYYKAGSTVDKTGTKLSGAISPLAITGLTLDSQYAFAVSAVSAGGESPLSNILTATPVGVLPAVPVLDSAIAGVGSVVFKWRAAARANEYELYFATGTTVDKSGVRMGNVHSPYTLTGLSNDTQYAFALAAGNDSGESALGNVLKATPTDPKPPKSAILTATPGTGKVTLVWKSVPTATSYTLYYAPNLRIYGTAASVTTSDTTLVVSGLSNCTDYGFSVTGTNKFGESDWSPVKLALLTSPLPVIVTQPAPVTKCVGASATFSVTVQDTTGVRYLWYRAGTVIDGAASRIYVLPSVAAADDGVDFYVYVENICGDGGPSTTAKLTVGSSCSQADTSALKP